jgi:predicted GH43/DUF377 family glycosyl hydrolase
MPIAKRYNRNPLLIPLKNHSWEAQEVFNGCPVKENDKIHFFYRAQSAPRDNHGVQMSVSSIGYAISKNNGDFSNRIQLIKPSEDWDKYGCEDPRATKINGKYYIFYTALSRYPFEADGIKIGVAISKDLKKFERHQVTTFNSKAMAMFPEKINGKYAVIFSADTDRPPTKICIAYFNEEKEMWSKRYWNSWYKKIEKHIVDFNKKPEDHIEIGAAPIRVPEGWLLIYSHVRNYFSGHPEFEIRAVMLDAKNPQKIIGRSDSALLVPEAPYEIYGRVPKVVFPSGAYIQNEELHLYYGGADTVCCAAKFNLQDVIYEVMSTPETRFSLKRYKKNPIVKPNPKNYWEAKATFNAAAIYEGGRFHILYRAMSNDNTSFIGYASSLNGLDIDIKSDEPIYFPREDFEQKHYPNGNSGCEDPRIVKIGSRIYMFYTAFDGVKNPRVAITSISKEDFLNHRWNWEKPKLISPEHLVNKNACVFPKKFNGQYIILHRLNNGIDLHYHEDLETLDQAELEEETGWIQPRPGKWDSRKIGIAGAPFKTKYGWILLYHGISDVDGHYRLGALLLDLKNPEEILARTENPILEPITEYESVGQVPHVVFSCGVVLHNETIYVYYGGGDTTLNVATVSLKDLIKQLMQSCYFC